MKPSSIIADALISRLARFVAGRLDHVLVHRLRLVEPALPHVARRRAARRGRRIVGIGFHQVAQDPLAFGRGAALEEHGREQPLRGAVLRALGRRIARALCSASGNRPARARSRTMRSPTAGFSGVARRELLEHGQRLVELVLVFVEVDERGRDLPVCRVGLVERAVELLGLRAGGRSWPWPRRRAAGSRAAPRSRSGRRERRPPPGDGRPRAGRGRGVTDVPRSLGDRRCAADSSLDGGRQPRRVLVRRRELQGPPSRRLASARFGSSRTASRAWRVASSGTFRSRSSCAYSRWTIGSLGTTSRTLR